MNDFLDNTNAVPSTQGYYGGIAETKMANIPTVKQRIDMAVRQAEEKLVAVKRAQEIFAKNPELEELMDIMQRSHF